VNKVVHEETHQLSRLLSLERLLWKEFDDDVVTDWSSRMFRELSQRKSTFWGVVGIVSSAVEMNFDSYEESAGCSMLFFTVAA